MSHFMKTRKGSASMYIVIFTTMLIAIIALSFVRVMLSESRQTTNYSLSQSAYNAALAGIEDAKVVLMKYQNCQSTGSRVNRTECARIISAMESEGSENNCNLIREAHGTNSGQTETLISSSETSNTSIEATARAIDQAYTCVKVNAESPDYITKLTHGTSSKIIPVRVSETDGGINSINRVVFRWFSDTDAEKLAGAGNIPDTYTVSRLNTNVTINQRTQNNSDINSLTPNRLGSELRVAPYLKVELIQTAVRYGLNQFYSAKDATTNRGTLVLRPSSKGKNSIKNIVSSASGNEGFAASAQKRLNFPIDIKCSEVKRDGSIAGSTSGYACVADIVIPRPVTSNLYNYDTETYQDLYTEAKFKERNPSTMFFRISLPYRDPETTVVAQLMNCASDSSSIDSADCKVVNFQGVQPMVDSTGRANDLFRRVEARLETINTYFPYPEAALSVTDSDDGVQKAFWVTKNCFSQTSSYNTTSDDVDITTHKENGTGSSLCYNAKAD